MTGALASLEPAGTLIVFFILHLLAGALLPYRIGQKPFLWSLMESAGAEMDRRLDRAGRGAGELIVRGFVTLAIMGLFAWLIGMAVERAGVYPYGWLAGVFFLSLCVSAMPDLKMMRGMIDALNKKDLKSAAAFVQPFYAEDLAKADAHTLVRRALELSAGRLNDWLVAPSLYFAAFGARGLALYVAFTAMFHAFGAARQKPFAVGARTAQNILNFIPARLTAILIVLGALFVSRSNPWRALKTAAAQAGNDSVMNRGWPLAALAGGLGVTLGGTGNAGWIGPKGSSAKLAAADLQRGAMLHFVVFVCTIIAVSAFFAVPYLAIME